MRTILSRQLCYSSDEERFRQIFSGLIRNSHFGGQRGRPKQFRVKNRGFYLPAPARPNLTIILRFALFTILTSWYNT